MKRLRPTAVLLACAVTACAGNAVATRERSDRLDGLDALVEAQMTRREIPGLSLAIIQDKRIVAARAYGVADEDTGAPVTTETLFQAASISKPVSSLAALHLVEEGRLSLDRDVNDELTSWEVPGNEFTATEKVTLRRLLSHTAGVTVYGFPGYDVAEPVPSLVQVLDGASPSNTAAIRVDTTPGTVERYSGGGFTIMQQLVIDVTGMPFSRYLRQTVLGPIGMTSSSFEQPPGASRAALTASGYDADRTPVRGRWYVYPELAAAGLWTTPTDLARFAIEIQQTLAGRGHGVISPAMARQYLTPQKGGRGLGIGLGGSGRELQFSHRGRNEGFDAVLVAFAETGQGAVIMMNANDDSRLRRRLLDHIARTYHWPTSDRLDAPAATRGRTIDAARLASYAGYYEAAENQLMALAPNAKGNGLETLVNGLPDEEFLALDDARFGSTERQARIAFDSGSGGVITAALWTDGNAGEPRPMPRVAPLLGPRRPTADADPALTRRIEAALEALQRGGAALAKDPDVTPGAKEVFRGGSGATLVLSALTYLGETDVAGRGIHRHGHDVARVRCYRTTTPAGERTLLVHLTAEGLVADYDVVRR